MGAQSVGCLSARERCRYIGYRGIRAPRIELFTPSPELDTRWEIIARDGQLVAQHRRYDDIPLDPGKIDDFSSRTWFLRDLRFTRGDEGRVTGFLVTSGRVRNLRFDRLQPESRAGG
jgi:hypothetical protein